MVKTNGRVGKLLKSMKVVNYEIGLHYRSGHFHTWVVHQPVGALCSLPIERLPSKIRRILTLSSTMATTAEALFDTFGKRYEDAFTNDPNLKEFLRFAMKSIPNHSKVLDVGCGTGKPVADILASAGHEVHGIDVSQNMIDIASAQVDGTFVKADMRNYEPQCPFDGVFVILFSKLPQEKHTRCASSSLNGSRPLRKPWMDSYTSEAFFSEERWKNMLQCTGFNIESEVRYYFTPNGPGHKYPEVHYLLLARKVEDQPLLGPYASPTKDELLSMHIRHHPVDRFTSFELDAFLEVVTEEVLLFRKLFLSNTTSHWTLIIVKIL
ncbi:hypothetical protein McanCB49686_006396 [Microsporum canis]